jgi:type IV secretory pathway VirB2 component (pilin)
MQVSVHIWQAPAWAPKARKAMQAGVKTAGALHVALTPVKLAMMAVPATAGTEGTFASVVQAALNVADWLCVGVIMFAGGSWMFGDRTRAMERLIGGGIGYIIIRKAHLLQQFLKSL